MNIIFVYSQSTSKNYTEGATTQGTVSLELEVTEDKIQHQKQLFAAKSGETAQHQTAGG